MKKIHIAISTDDIEKTVTDYTERLGFAPCVLVPQQYALWRSDTLNLSVRQDVTARPGSLRHLGWEDPDATAFTQNADVNGVVWERFNAAHQAEEINALWPDAGYKP
ncbi:hypothetical protein K8B33_06880 [Alcanivorax sp. JB21]|uniref:VOC family protein n=1 Tax=Alcanivorax limicola TaxID=2874102 RepID=UPI001CBDDA69|nr:hypothetical protein [Alcanivorax limicola]MBZ2188813.1 hypothetical protein [Alcanivorax limicola]